ncbi:MULTISPECIES: type II toxin-antitoxin system VapC family toxin [unclassified Caulobacter]|uniref:type II toxin-antitoxin system VapC family toxin n=1 Tax=unclassified Caulobacter TaxID=2648921 RepID=UPI001E58C545|nr:MULTISPECIES: type II toxin-antitoxin system VapC family toxin [unclassified Caulobacter]
MDASALVAMALAEPERSSFELVIAQTDALLATPINLMEAGIILVLREKRFTADEYHRWLGDLDIVSSSLVGEREALQAYLRWGKGVHRAGLNMGDCFAYALAKSLDAPLLYKGDDFPLTDVRSALA